MIQVRQLPLPIANLCQYLTVYYVLMNIYTGYINVFVLTDHAHVVSLVDEVLETVEHTPAGGGDSTVDTSLLQKDFVEI